MTIWVDADAAPNACKEILVRASRKRDFDVVLVANRWLEKPKAARVTVQTVGMGEDVADDYIVEQCQEGDLVVTFDIPLAARAVEEGALVITPHGKELDESNVRERLSRRNFAHELRSAGIDTGGPSAFGASQKQAFANALDRWLTARE
jgi:uncharacterized protein YaiI (UPF0178 family)